MGSKIVIPRELILDDFFEDNPCKKGILKEFKFKKMKLDKLDSKKLKFKK